MNSCLNENIINNNKDFNAIHGDLNGGKLSAPTSGHQRLTTVTSIWLAMNTIEFLIERYT